MDTGGAQRDHGTAEVMLVVLNPAGQITLLNREGHELLGYDDGELLGENWFDKCLPSHVRESVRSVFEQLLTGDGKAVECHENPVLTRDGRELLIAWHNSVVTDDAGQVTGLFSSGQNITEQRQAEDVLRAREAFASKIVQTSINGIYIYDLVEGANVYINPTYTKITGHTLESLNTLSPEEFFALFHPEDQPRIAEHMQEVIDDRSGDVVEIEYRFKTTDGRWVWCLSWDSVFERDEDGKVKQFMGTFADITERKLAEEEIRRLNEDLEERVRRRTADLEAANNELEAFAYSVSHDLRAPLRAIDGFSRILAEEHAPRLAAEARRYLDLVRGNARRMGELIDDLLTFSRLGRQTLSVRRVAPADLVRAVIAEDLRHQMEGRDVEITVADLPACEADPNLLRQVYVNLLENALKYTAQREGTRIEVGCRNDDDEHGGVVYFVRDNGVGFDMRYADKLFGVFQRLHRAEEYEGTGVGLATVQRVIHRHGGQVWADAAVGEGATFYFTLGEGPNDDG